MRHYDRFVIFLRLTVGLLHMRDLLFDMYRSEVRNVLGRQTREDILVEDNIARDDHLLRGNVIALESLIPILETHVDAFSRMRLQCLPRL